MLWTRQRSWRIGLGAAMTLGLVIAVAAARDQPDVAVVTMDPSVVRQGARGGRIAPTGQAGAEPTCTTPQPIGTWSCQNGVWVAGIAPASGPNGTGPGNCITPSPGAGWSCQNGSWVSSSASESGGGRGNASNADTQSTASTPATTTALPCPPPAPAPGWTCQNGTWTAPTGVSPQDQPVQMPMPASPNSNCASAPPTATATCQNGMWVVR